MDKTLIINKIKEYYNFKSDSEFARHLEISSQVLSNWKSRNTFDPALIYTKCLDINAEWLLTGKGEMLKSTYKSVDMVNEVQAMYAKEEKTIEALKSDISYKNIIIAGLERENKLLWKLVDSDDSSNEKKQIG